MPDRYGENDPDIDRITDYRAIDACGLCDENGYVGGTVCDHFDHTAAAKRGMAMIRAAMGWKDPQDSREHATHPMTPDPP